ncbi:phosphotransferase family protein [Actinomadura decatromicini]|uniref:phosphotransferase family protein n=1 Tax=Actinomadura decatromicini TaxID=2604572 RepID=UPI001CA30463|nr:phosphotransferase family protein [Actinomadura decatromicini]
MTIERDAGWDALVRPDRLGPALADATGDAGWTGLTATLVAGGKSNLTFLLSGSAGELVLRRPPSGELLPSAHDMGREARVQRALAPSAVPVPRIVLSDDGSIIGAPFYVMERVEGRIIRDELPGGYADAPGARARLAFALVDVLAALHRVDPRAVGLDGYGRPDGFVARQVRRWNDQWLRSRNEPVAAVEELGRRVSERIPESRRASIVHGDFRLDNCMMDEHDPGRVRAVLDWEMSTLGDPLTDLALLLFYWQEPGEPGLRLTPAVTALPGFPDRAEIAARYARQADVELADLAFYEALAHYKCAVITQGVAARARAGAMAGQEFGDLDGEVRAIAERGLARLDFR